MKAQTVVHVVPNALRLRQCASCSGTGGRGINATAGYLWASCWVCGGTGQVRAVVFGNESNWWAK